MTLNRRDVFRALLGGATAFHLSSAADPPGKRNMIVRSARPEDYEMPLDGFTSWITPVDRFYVRTHDYTPQVDVKAWRLQIAGEVEHPLTLAIDDLHKLPRVDLVSVMECAGNGRALFEPPMRGVQWVYGAVGNARWSGVRFRDVLEHAGVKASSKHVLLDGADVGLGSQPDFQRSIPVDRALEANTLLAYEMNGAPLTPAHGFPLRVVVPGWAGDSWTKWLTSIRLVEREFEGPYMKVAYRHPGKPVKPGKSVPPESMKPVTTLAVKCIIAAPFDGDAIPNGAVAIHGAAWSGAAPIDRVEVSVDRGRTWQNAKLGTDEARYAWRLWTHTWTPREPAHYVIMARAFDHTGNTQPLNQEWNPSGYLHNAVQQVAIDYGAPREKPVPAQRASGREALAGYQQPRGFRSACLTCHDEDIIMQQRLTRVQWREEVERMAKWGARVNPADREGIVDYLYKLYGPRPRT